MPVVNYHRTRDLPPNAVWIMRGAGGNDLGNPFRIGPDGDRAEVLRKFKRWLWEQLKKDPVFRAKVAALHGKTLVCCCKPKDCHGDTLERAAAWLVATGCNHRWGVDSPAPSC